MSDDETTLWNCLKKYKIIQVLYNACVLFTRVSVNAISSIFRVDNNKVLLQAYEGRQYSCNPKYIAKFLKKHSSLKIVFSLQNQEEHSYLQITDYEIVRSKSLKFIYHYFTAKVVIVNDFLPMIVPLKQNQISINTWHGGGAYKKVGISLSKTDYYSQRYIWQHKVDYMISSCAAFSELAITAFGIEKQCILPIGMPRNDIFFNRISQNKASEKVRKFYGIDKFTRIVLYAPTYRESKVDSLYGLNFTKVLDALKEKLGGEWLFLFRGHYFLSDSKKFESSCFINASEYDDMQELLCAADCLITDYSSSVWDFSLTLKPCFLYATDLEEYKKEIDFYYPIEKWPFTLGENNTELLNNILNFNEADYIERVKQHHKALGSYEDGHACERVCKLIEEICNEKK